jgi:hypothetical protein
MGVRAMDRHAEAPGSSTDRQQEATPHQGYSIIGGTLLWTRAIFTYLRAGTACSAASSMPHVRHVNGSSD